MRRFFSLIWSSTLLLVACGGNAPGLGGPSGSSSTLEYGGSSLLLSNGMAELYEVEGYHYTYDVTLTDGNFVPVTIYVGDIPISYWIATSDKAEVHAELFVAGSTFQPGTFTFAAPQEGSDRPSRVGQNYFEEAYVGVDLNGDEKVSKEEEVQVAGGTVTVAGTLPTLSVNFDFQLANGLRAQGGYQGEFFAVD